MAGALPRPFITAFSLALLYPAAAEAADAPMIMAYKRDPLPIYGDAGDKLRDVPVASMPAAGTPAARVVGAKTGFVAVRIDGQPAWLRLSTVDYVGDVAAIKCDATAMAFAKMEEDGLDQSLGLACAKK